jgi:hypothetical protein
LQQFKELQQFEEFKEFGEFKEPRFGLTDRLRNAYCLAALLPTA